VQLDSKGDVLVLDRKAKRIARLDPKGLFKAWVDAKGVADVVPGAFKLDAADNLYVLDLAGRAILVLDPSGAVTRRIDFAKNKVLFTDVAVDLAGTVYAVDALGATVWAIEKGGAELKPFSKSLKEMMSFPSYLAMDGKGTMYVVDQNGMGVVLLGADGSYVGRRLAIGWSEGTVYYPAQVCVTSTGDMLLADRGNNRVQQFAVTR
jgi:sugar lactone lactonase YvrE